MHDWARANGYLVSERGRLAREITETFFAAHPEILERARTFEMVHATARTPARRRRTARRTARLATVTVELRHLRRPILGAAVPGAR
ncbi:Lsr2 family DNA-binding protein [Nonomuraea maheshkhaliensis]|uniref:Lsr2 family DNA-binding protein n=1 Tax=Nonomuraea maheshkhaliensis TaxID=419590 RepID=UPI003D15C427